MTRPPSLHHRVIARTAAGMLLVAAVAGTLGAAGAAPDARAESAGPAATASAPPPGADAFTPAQREAIVAIMRDAMKRDPTILADAINTLRAADEQREATAQAGAIAANRAAIDDTRTGFVAGAPDGDVTLVEFFDPRCPYCRRMVPVINDRIAADHRLRVIFRAIPILGAPSVLAARAIDAAGLAGRYRPMMDALMLADTPPTADTIHDAARRVGLDPAALDRAMASDAVTARIRGDLALAKTLGVDGTPAFVIGDQLVPGAMTPAELSRAIGDARS